MEVEEEPLLPLMRNRRNKTRSRYLPFWQEKHLPSVPFWQCMKDNVAMLQASSSAHVTIPSNQGQKPAGEYTNGIGGDGKKAFLMWIHLPIYGQVQANTVQSWGPSPEAARRLPNGHQSHHCLHPSFHLCHYHC